jgi:predicted SAM-dependent methyltransferase
MNYVIIGNMNGSDLKRILIFELKSLVGRTFLKRKTRINIKTNPALLDIGAGSNLKEGWIHIDFFIIKSPIKMLLKYRKGKNNPEVQTDLRFGLNCPNEVIDGVYTSHTIEHFNYRDAKSLLNEIHRVLKKDRWLRIIVPDLELVVQYYNKKNKLFDFHRTGCEAISSLTQDWDHKSVWDKELLKIVLKELGFRNIKVVEYGKEVTDRRLIKEEESRRFESLVMEAQK